MAGIGHGGRIAPWVLDGAMNRASFETCVEKERAFALRPGQVVVADNLSLKSPRVVKLLADKDCEIIILPPCSPDPCAAKNSPLDCFLHAPHPSKWHSQN